MHRKTILVRIRSSQTTSLRIPRQTKRPTLPTCRRRRARRRRSSTRVSIGRSMSKYRSHSTTYRHTSSRWADKFVLIKPRGGSRGDPKTPPPPPFWGTLKLHKEGKNLAGLRANTPRFSTLQLPGLPPFRNPVSAPVKDRHG